MNFRSLFIIAIGAILLFTGIVSAGKLHEKIKERQRAQVALSEFRHVRYGLLNPHEWKRKLTDIFTKNIESFDWENMDKSEVREQIIKILESLFPELEKFLNEQQSQGTWLLKTFRSAAIALFDLQQLKEQIPSMADRIMEELDKPEARANIKKFIEDKINSIVEESIGIEDNSALLALQDEYNCEDNEVCKSDLVSDISVLNDDILQLTAAEFACIFILFCLWFFDRDAIFRQWYFFLLFAGLLVLLFSGVASPMISIDARLNEVSLKFMDQDISFKDQVLFYQSKSIMDVIYLLLKQGSGQTLLVGVLIMMFSIIFPLIKLTSILLINLVKPLKNNRTLHFMAHRTGKWSMADVFVVAIFMAFLGFRGILSSQLNQLESASNKASIIATDSSTLQEGILLFAAYVILGIVFSSMSKKVDFEERQELIVLK